jgi:hypothetical protein
MTTSKRPAFAWIELLLVLAIVAVGYCLLVVAIRRAREKAEWICTMNNLKQVGLSIHNANDTYKRCPPAWGEFPPRANADQAQTHARATVHLFLYPFMESQKLFVRMAQAPPRGENTEEALRTWRTPLVAEVIPPMVSPMDFTNPEGTVTVNNTVYGVQNFAANIRVFGPLAGDGAQPGVEPTSDAFDGAATIPGTFKDGTSNTITFATRYGRCGAHGSTWSQPGVATLGPFASNGAFFGSTIAPALTASGDNASGDDTTFQVAPTEPRGPNACNPFYAQSFTRAGLQVAIADGSVRTVAPTVSIRTWSRLLIPNDGFGLDSDW